MLPWKAAGLLVLVWPALGLAQAPAAEQCLGHAQIWEARFGLPDQVVAAVAIAESGRTQAGGHRIAWPWTINADGQGYFFDSKAEAIRHAQQFKRAGARNLDVGCMQISLRAHPNAFASLDEAFDPAANTRYGASFLKQLAAETGSWPQAIGSYHSRTPDLLIEYRDRVLGIWRRLSRHLPIMAAWRSPTPTLRSPGRIPDYPEAAMGKLEPVAALARYRERLAFDPQDRKAALGRAVALDRMAGLRQMPQAQARIAYAQSLRADPASKAALGRLLDLIAQEEPAEQKHQLEQAVIMAGGPAGLVLRLAEVAESLGENASAESYRRQAKTLERHQPK